MQPVEGGGEITEARFWQVRFQAQHFDAHPIRLAATMGAGQGLRLRTSQAVASSFLAVTCL